LCCTHVYTYAVSTYQKDAFEERETSISPGRFIGFPLPFPTFVTKCTETTSTDSQSNKSPLFGKSKMRKMGRKEKTQKRKK
jgi:hypothetical protein